MIEIRIFVAVRVVWEYAASPFSLPVVVAEQQRDAVRSFVCEARWNGVNVNFH